MNLLSIVNGRKIKIRKTKIKGMFSLLLYFIKIKLFNYSDILSYHIDSLPSIIIIWNFFKDISIIKLTSKQNKFCEIYLCLGNASEFYRQVYNANKMKSKTINEKASLLFKKDNIKTRVDE